MSISINYRSDVLPSDTIYHENFFIEYMKIAKSLSSYNYFSKVNLIDDIDLSDKDIIFYETLNPMESIKKIKRDNKSHLIFFIVDVVRWNYTDDAFQELVNTTNNFTVIFFETVLNENKKYFNFPYITLNRCATNIHIQVSNYKKTMLDIFRNSRNYYRQFYFNCFNNTVKEHRIDILKFMCENDLTDKGIVSWFAGSDADLSLLDGVEFTDKEKSFIGKSHDLKVIGKQDYLNFIPYFNSYFSIITESDWYIHDNRPLPKIQITEKVFKALVSFSPFIIISTRDYLKKLREWGFKTFDGWIDESYDKLETYEERKKVIYSEINRLNNMSKDELDKWYWEMEAILIHNHNHFFTFVNNEFNKLRGVIDDIYR